jgi:SsrA-binding protein
VAAKPERRFKVVSDNRKARFNYAIGDTFEAGIVLTGSEVKSLRAGKATIAESYADARGGELWLINSNIPEYLQASRFNHAPKRARKLLLQKREINRLVGAVEREGMTIVPLKLYFNEKGRAKVEIALARGKKLHDKRETLKKRSWERERGRLMRMKGSSCATAYADFSASPRSPQFYVALLDHAAGNAPAGFAGRVGFIVVAARVNDHGRPVSVEHGIRLAFLECKGGVEHFDDQVAALRDVQIGHVTGVLAFRRHHAVLFVARIEVSARRSEWRLALADRMDVKCVLAWRQSLNRSINQHALWRLREID